MLLAIDVGNTNITCAAYKDRTLVNEWRISTSGSRTAEEYGVWLSQAMAIDGLKLNDVTHAIVATVVPETLFNIKGFCRRYFGVTPLVIGESNVDLGMTPLIDRPSEAGADRLVNAVGAHSLYGRRTAAAGNRQEYDRMYAGRHLLRLYRDGGGAGIAHQRRIWQRDENSRNRRSRAAVLARNGDDRDCERRSDPRGAC